MKKILAIFLALLMTGALSACSGWSVEVKEPESGAESDAAPGSSTPEAEPEYYEFPPELALLLDSDNCAWQDIACSITRTNEGLKTSVSGRAEELLAAAVEGFSLRRAGEDEAVDYYLAYPFALSFTAGESTFSYEFISGAVLIGGERFVPTENLDAFTSDNYCGIDWISSELFTLGSVLNFTAKDVVKVEADYFDGEDAEYDGEAAADFFESSIACWVVRNRRIRANNSDNPNTGSGTYVYTITLADGSTHTIGDLGLIWVDDDPLYYLIAYRAE